MKVTIHFVDVHGMPRMVIDQPIAERGDGVRLLNWGRDRYLDFKDLCEEHKAATEKVLEDKRRGVTREYRNRFTDLFYRAMARREAERNG